MFDLYIFIVIVFPFVNCKLQIFTFIYSYCNCFLFCKLQTLTIFPFANTNCDFNRVKWSSCHPKDLVSKRWGTKNSNWSSKFREVRSMVGCNWRSKFKELKSKEWSNKKGDNGPWWRIVVCGIVSYLLAYNRRLQLMLWQSGLASTLGSRLN